MDDDWSYWQQQYLNSTPPLSIADFRPLQFKVDNPRVSWHIGRLDSLPSHTSQFLQVLELPLIEPPKRSRVDTPKCCCKTVVRFKRPKFLRPTHKYKPKDASSLHLLEAPLNNLPTTAAASSRSISFDPSDFVLPHFGITDFLGLDDFCTLGVGASTNTGSLLEPLIPFKGSKLCQLRHLFLSVLPACQPRFPQVVAVSNGLEVIPRPPIKSLSVFTMKIVPFKFPQTNVGRPRLSSQACLSTQPIESMLAEDQAITISPPTLANFKPQAHGLVQIARDQILVNRTFFELEGLQSIIAPSTVVVERDFFQESPPSIPIPLIALSASVCVLIVHEPVPLSPSHCEPRLMIPFPEVHLIALVPSQDLLRSRMDQLSMFAGQLIASNKILRLHLAKGENDVSHIINSLTIPEEPFRLDPEPTAHERFLVECLLMNPWQAQVALPHQALLHILKQ